MSSATEQEIITLLLGAPQPGRGLSSPGDDAVEVPGGALVSVDAMVEGVHFDHRLDASDVGWKLVAVNASDIGACGRAPTWALLALSVPSGDRLWLSGFAEGFHSALLHWGVTLQGGDTTRSPGPRVLSLTIGSGPSGPSLTRSGACAGDDLWVTGALGRSAAGFHYGTPAGLAWLRRPSPPVRFGAALGAAGLPSAMMDLSDGLAADLSRLCLASEIGAHIDPGALPSDAALTGTPPSEALSLMTSFGEDYELLFAAAPSSRRAIASLAAAHGISAQRIGCCLPHGSGITLGAQQWPDARFSHF